MMSAYPMKVSNPAIKFDLTLMSKLRKMSYIILMPFSGMKLQ